MADPKTILEFVKEKRRSRCSTCALPTCRDLQHHVSYPIDQLNEGFV